MTHRFAQLLTVAVAAVGLCGIEVSMACTSSQQQGAQTAAHVLTVGADICEAIARARGRDDVAALCRATHDGAAVLDRATEPAVCELDAGHE